MHPHPFRLAAISAASACFLAAAASRLGAETAPSPRTGFSGSWGLTEATVSDPAAALGKVASAAGADGSSGAAGRGRGGRGGSGSLASALDDPLEALGDARRVVVVDDGRRVEITYPSGRKRVVITDGEEREQDDGDGPAKVDGEAEERAGADHRDVQVVGRAQPERDVGALALAAPSPRRGQGRRTPQFLLPAGLRAGAGRSAHANPGAGRCDGPHPGGAARDLVRPRDGFRSRASGPNVRSGLRAAFLRRSSSGSRRSPSRMPRGAPSRPPRHNGSPR